MHSNCARSLPPPHAIELQINAAFSRIFQGVLWVLTSHHAGLCPSSHGLLPCIGSRLHEYYAPRITTVVLRICLSCRCRSTLAVLRNTRAGKSSDRALFPEQWPPQGPKSGGCVGHERVHGPRGDYDAGSYLSCQFWQLRAPSWVGFRHERVLSWYIYGDDTRKAWYGKNTSGGVYSTYSARVFQACVQPPGLTLFLPLLRPSTCLGWHVCSTNKRLICSGC